MKLILIILLFLGLHEVKALSAIDNPLQKVRILSSRYLNYSCSPQDDSVLELCHQAEKWSELHHDNYSKFKARQLSVNALCLRGDIGLGTNLAGNMYKEAKQLNYTLGVALSLQSLGAAYMHAGMYRQADSLFAETTTLMEHAGDTLSKLQLVMQQLHNHMLLADSVSLLLDLAQAKGLTGYLDSTERKDYQFYILCYEATSHIWHKDSAEAMEYMAKMLANVPASGFFARWQYSLQARYHEMKAEHELALGYCDSTLWAIIQKGNMNEYAGSMLEKSLLLEIMGRKEEACQIYERINYLTDSLNMHRYIKQINALRLDYQVDQMELRNLNERNRLLTVTQLCSIGVGLVILLFIILVRRKNKRLIQEKEKLNAMRIAAADSIQSKSIFLSNMSHDLRTPLNAIVGFSRILTETEVTPEMKLQCQDYVKQNSALLIKLVNDIVDFSNLKEAKIKFNYKPCEVVGLCKSVLETVGNVHHTAATLKFECPLSSLEIETDSERLQQVLINLLVNATKFTKEGTIRLILNFDEKHKEAIFTVEDTGCGIPAEKQDRIFERFEKLHDMVQGVGLGLSICKIILEHVGGKIWLDPTYSAGARFIFTHPISQPGNSSKEMQ